MSPEEGCGLVGAVLPGQNGIGAGQDRVPDLEFQLLVGLGVGVGQNVQADDMVSQLGLGRLGPQGRADQTGHQQGQELAPGKGRTVQVTHGKTPSTFLMVESMDGVFAFYTGRQKFIPPVLPPGQGVRREAG